jgi:predicted HAD superfamily hydrolase
MDNQITNRVDQASLVSFDIFDTAVLRTVSKPPDVFLVVLEQYQAQHGSLDIPFCEARQEAEKQVRKNTWEKWQETEITLDAIYDFLSLQWEIPQKEAIRLKTLELKAEESLVVQNPFIFEIYSYCLKQEIPVIFTSDIYLPEQTICNILDKTGYQSRETVFLSSTRKVTKAAGGLYQCLIKEMHCQPDTILHIGDNYDSDIKQAQSFGITTYYYEQCRSKAAKDPLFQKNILEPFQNVHSKLEQSLVTGPIMNAYYAERNAESLAPLREDFWYTLGYWSVGILYLAFADWVRRQAIQDKIDRLYFLARDGYIMQTVYNELKQVKTEAPESCYLYASRRAYNIPAITTLTEQDIDFLVSGTSRLTLGQFLGRIGLDADSLGGEIQKAGFHSSEDLVQTGLDYGRLRLLYRIVAPHIQDIAQKERAALKSYFQETGLLDDSTNVAVVDIGWHGSMQRSLDIVLGLFGNKPKIQGYYFGTFPPAEQRVKQGYKISSFLCHLGQPQKYHQLVKQCVELFEFIHSAPHGSLVKFESHGDTVQPIFDNDVRPDKRRQAQRLQEGALDFIRDFLRTWPQVNFLTLSTEAAIAPLARLLENPTTQEAVLIGNLTHCEGFGDVYQKRHIARPPRIWTKIFRPDILVKEYRQAFWKKAYLKRCLTWK